MNRAQVNQLFQTKLVHYNKTCFKLSLIRSINLICLLGGGGGAQNDQSMQLEPTAFNELPQLLSCAQMCEFYDSYSSQFRCVDLLIGFPELVSPSGSGILRHLGIDYLALMRAK